MVTKSAPNNQSLEWYQKALENNCIGNGGEGKDYDQEELVQAYYKKCNRVDEENHKKRVQERLGQAILEEDLIPTVPLLIRGNKFDLIYDEENKTYIMIPEIIREKNVSITR